MAWNKYGWTYNGPDASGCLRQTKQGRNGEELVYYGQVDTDNIPNGIGSLMQDGKYIHHGFWQNGEIVAEYDLEKYNTAMNEIQRRKY